MVWNTERKCFVWELSANGINTLQTFAYETEVFLLFAENMAVAESNFANALVYGFKGIREMRKAFSSVWNTTVRGDGSDCIATKLFR